MSEVADLSGGAAKLLLALIRRGGAWGSPAEMMAEAGVSKNTYFEAKRDLQSQFSDLVSQLLGMQSQNVTKQAQEVGQPFQFVGQPFPVLDPSASARLAATATVPYFGQTWPDPAPMRLPEVPAEERNFPPNFATSDPETPRQACARADREGRGQAEAVQAAFSFLAPKQQPVVLYQAKELLALAPAEDIYDAVEMAVQRGIERPLPYVRKVLMNRPKATAPQPTPSTSIDEDHTGEMDEWTPEWEAKVRKGEEKLRRMGYGHLFGKEAE